MNYRNELDDCLIYFLVCPILEYCFVGYLTNFCNFHYLFGIKGAQAARELQ